jgi:LEA14-like dessication related protein
LALIGAQVLACATAKDTAGQSAPTVAADSQKAEVTKQSLTDLTLSEQVVLQNSAATKAHANSAHWELVVDGNVVASGDQTLDVDLPPGASTEVTLVGSGSYAHNIDEVQTLAAHRGGIPVSLRGTLSVTTGAEGGPTTLDFAKASFLREPRVPQVVMHDVGASHYDDGHVNLSFEMAIDNPNPFPVDVASFKYRIEVNGHLIDESTVGQNAQVPPSAKKVFEVTSSLDEKGFPGLDDIYKKNSMAYSLTGELDFGLAKADIKLESPINFSR